MPMPRLSPEQQPDSHILPADYQSPCAVCHRPIRPGDEIIHSWRPYELNAHSRCTTQAELESVTKTVVVEFSIWPGLIFCDDECWYRVIATRYPNYLPPDKRQLQKQAKKGKAKKQDGDEPLQDITSICYLRPATASEIAATQEKFYRASRRDDAQEKRREIARLVREQGESIEGASAGERLLEQSDSFGGHSYFVLDGEYVVYIKSTGRDGHMPEGVEIAWRVEADYEFKEGLCELAAVLSPSSN